MDAYSGIYELTLIVSDTGLDNPIIWNFGKLEIIFNKPLDPSTLTPSNKNIQKSKIQPHFEPEENHNKNIFVSDF